ncbi:MAG: hypothetical protein ACRD3J_06825, partial [Thermoanaerobaculia bacterium]
MLNIAGPDYDYAQVVYVVLQECEHRRRGFDEAEFDAEVTRCATGKLAEIKSSYDEFGGSAVYWGALEKEVDEVVLPQYIAAARVMTDLERNSFGIWRGGDLGARFAFALAGLLIGSIIIALPFIPIYEDLFAFALTAAGFLYPDLKRFMHQRRYMKVLNRLVADSARYQ